MYVVISILILSNCYVYFVFVGFILFQWWLKIKSVWRDVFLSCFTHKKCINTSRPGQNGRHFADDTFKRIFLNENFRISIKISLKFVPKGPNNNNPALVQVMAWRRSGDKPLSETLMVSLLTHICVTRPQRVKCKRRVMSHKKNSLGLWNTPAFVRCEFW